MYYKSLRALTENMNFSSRGFPKMKSHLNFPFKRFNFGHDPLSHGCNCILRGFPLNKAYVPFSLSHIIATAATILTSS